MKEGNRFERQVTALIEASIATKQTLLGSPDVVLKIAKVSEILVDAFKRGHKAFLFGNGGSAADAQHIAAGFVGRFAFDHALFFARKMGLQTVALTGCTGGELLDKVDYCICAPSKETPRIQECHILIGHIISELVEREIFHEESSLPRS